ncbi:malonate transporter MadL [Thalassobacillus devorans]|uniref:Malonate transporter MadL n=1 Tax=Thalassobacillus devorans TaxID=279813 RepID=A0ABQ1NS53_9BACI|nr:malonate transporter subunit MadL [Thalassobacillus devorans]NIK28783.1 malonate transporter MadL subunit [Thalassobacillus devorans]GGC83564.1 malonate transporter MadL [Thalassobacillus devorans]
MVIYGVALLAICLLAGTFLGELLGVIVGVDANVGGVGIAMLMLVLLVDYLKRNKKLTVKSQEGVSFWSAMYIPIVIAMAAKQNVVAALDGGPVAILAGVAVVGVSWAMVPLLSKIGREKDSHLKPEMIGGDNHVRDAK